MVDVPTEKMSFKGWSFKEWARHNKESFKATVLLFAGYNYMVGFSWQALLVALGVIVGKMAVDSIDFYFAEN